MISEVFMTKFKPNFFVLLAVISVIYLLTRLINLTSVPVFGDEAIYLRWSQLIKNVETLRFIPLTDGKQPLYMWLTVPFLKLVSDPLVAGRLLSVIIGLFSLIGLCFTFALYLNYSSKNRQPHLFIIESLTKNPLFSLIPGLIYLFLPLTFFFDRLALPDGLLSFFGIMTLFFTLLLAKYPRLDLSIFLGLILGLAWITKSPAIYFVVLSFLGFIILSRSKKYYYPLISIFLGFIIYNLLRLGPQFQQIALRNRDYIWPLSKILKQPLDPFIPHLKDLFVFYLQYLSFPLLILSLVGFILYFFKTKSLSRLSFFILCFYLLPTIANLAMAKIFTGRYLLFTTPALIILISLSLIKFFHHSHRIFQSFYRQLLVVILCFLPNLYWLTLVSFKPFQVKLPTSESGYLEGWTAGWGIKQVSDYLISRSKNYNVIVGTEGYFGTLPDGLQIYTDSLPHLTVFGLDPELTQIPFKLIDAKNFGDDVYLLLNSPKKPLDQSSLDRLTLIKNFSKPDGSSLLLYQL
jgi:4-amino-4-deoxy-L-arabinose transferase-like glycosyltransferase